MIISKKKHLEEIGKLKEEIMNLNLKLNELLKNEIEIINDREFYKAKYYETISYTNNLEKKIRGEKIC